MSLNAQIQALVDANGLSPVLNSLANACLENAQVVRRLKSDNPKVKATNEVLAQNWQSRGSQIARIILISPSE